MIHSPNALFVLLFLGYTWPTIGDVHHSPDLAPGIDPNPSATTTVETATPISPAQSSILSELQDECLLWNNSCSGKRSQALSQFFDKTVLNLLDDACFLGSANCSAAIQREFVQVKHWMESPQCMSSQREWEPGVRIIDGLSDRCCYDCDLEVDDVDLYYWLEPEADTSCLSIVGESVNPVDYGATTVPLALNISDTVWICTTHPQVSITSIITTAVLSYDGAMTFKYLNTNPWSVSSCTNDRTASFVSNSTKVVNNLSVPIRARGHSLIVSNSFVPNDGASMTVTSGSFTFTSPTIYANFHGLKSINGCGGKSISATMLTFNPGDLSTLVGPLGHQFNDISTSRQFNIQDLPCPPQDIMEENWYKPAPGEPYRPIIAIPEQIKSLLPGWSHCIHDFFTGIDPPRSLHPAAFMAPSVTTSDPRTFSVAPKPSATRETIPMKTIMPDYMASIGTVATIASPSSASRIIQPKKTTDTRRYSEQKDSDLNVFSEDPDIRQSGRVQSASGSGQEANIPGSPHSTAAVPPAHDPRPSSSDKSVSPASHTALLDPSGSKLDDNGAPAVDSGHRATLSGHSVHTPAQVYDSNIAGHGTSHLLETLIKDTFTLLPDVTPTTVSSRLRSIDSIRRNALETQLALLPEIFPVPKIIVSKGAAKISHSNEFSIYDAAPLPAADTVTAAETRTSLNTLSESSLGDAPDAVGTVTPSINRENDSQIMTSSSETIQSHSDHAPTANSYPTTSTLSNPVSETPASVQSSALTSGASSSSSAAQSPGTPITTNASRLETAHMKNVNVTDFNSTSKAPGMTVKTFEGHAERRGRSAVWGTISLLMTLMIVLVFID